MSEIEDKLQKDSMTIKEQIMNLKNTISKFKNDMLGSSAKKNDDFVSKLNVNISNDKEEIDENKSNNRVEDNSDKYLKFSFNNRHFVEQKKEVPQEEVHYIDDGEEEEEEPYNYPRKIKSNDNNDLDNTEENFKVNYENKPIYNSNVNYRDSNASFKASLANYANYNNENNNVDYIEDKNDIPTNRIKANIQSFNYENVPSNNKSNEFTQSKKNPIIEESTERLRIANKYIETNTSNNDDELQVEDLSQNNSNKKKGYSSIREYKTLNQRRILYDEKSSDESSLDERIKKLQKQKFTIESSSPQQIPKPKSKAKTITRPKSTQKMVYHAPMTTKSTYKKTSLNSNNSKNDDTKLIKSYQSEINTLKATILKLKNENQKLKNSLQKERAQNEKYRQLTEEIIKHYEKTKKYK